MKMDFFMQVPSSGVLVNGNDQPLVGGPCFVTG